MDDEGNELKYSCKQRDTESLAKRNRRIKLTNKKRSVLNHQLNSSCPDIIECETELSAYSSNTVNIQLFKDYIKKKHEVNVKVKSYYEAELNRKINWRTKVYRQKAKISSFNVLKLNLETRKISWYVLVIGVQNKAHVSKALPRWE